MMVVLGICSNRFLY